MFREDDVHLNTYGFNLFLDSLMHALDYFHLYPTAVKYREWCKFLVDQVEWLCLGQKIEACSFLVWEFSCEIKQICRAANIQILWGCMTSFVILKSQSIIRILKNF